MNENREDKVFWLADSEVDKPYDLTTWYRCVGGQDFVEKVEKENKIVAVIFSDNNLGFILEKKVDEKAASDI